MAFIFLFYPNPAFNQAAAKIKVVHSAAHIFCNYLILKRFTKNEVYQMYHIFLLFPAFKTGIL